jgi:hypothetical protein
VNVKNSSLLLPLSFLSFTSAWSLRDGLESGERVSPESVEISAQRFQAGRVYRVYATSSFRAVGDQTCILEHPEVLGDRGAADWKVISQLAHGVWADYEALEDSATGAIAQGVPRVSFVSNH